MTESLTILVAEDDYQIQEMVEEALTEAGFRPQILSSAEEAATVLKSGIYEFRALVTDVNLRGKTSGWDLARLVRERDPEFPVVYMTGMSADEWARLGVPRAFCSPSPSRRPSSSPPSRSFSTRDRPLSEGPASWASEQSNEGDHGEQTGRRHAPA